MKSVVDDGSTDDSLAIIREKFGSDSRIKIVTKRNQGQLSSFNEEFLASAGDIVFFLDADDVYEVNDPKTAMGLYHEDGRCDFLFCTMTEFVRRNGTKRLYPADRQVGFTGILTLIPRKWLPAFLLSLVSDLGIFGAGEPMKPRVLANGCDGPDSRGFASFVVPAVCYM